MPPSLGAPIAIESAIVSGTQGSISSAPEDDRARHGRASLRLGGVDPGRVVFGQPDLLQLQNPLITLRMSVVPATGTTQWSGGRQSSCSVTS